ncbi:TetR/AcrR family transcriptional regulator [Williamsia muralis]|uniref:TetR/AcrR family transcriptional regulator n=1 Tax=Williamsia marianensis TaxID=85044 RepID=UPI003F13B32E
MSADWLVGSDRTDVARERMLNLAGALIAERGIDRFDLNELAARAHCSRATVYRHTGGRTRLLEAVFTHTSSAIAETVGHAVAGLAGEQRAQTAIAVTLGEFRTNRIARQFLRSRHVLDGAKAATRSPVLWAIAAELTGIDPANTIASSLAVRSVLTLALWPPANPADEPHLIAALCAALLAADC